MSTPTKNKSSVKGEKRRASRAKPKPEGYVSGVYKQEEFRQYGLFMALPIEDRKAIFGITTDAQFAAKFNLHPGTLSEWKWKSDLWEIRDQYLMNFKKYTAPIIRSLARRAERTGEAFHSLTFLKVVEGFTEKTAMDLTSKGKRITGFDVVVRHAKNEPTSSRDPKSAGKK